MYLPPHFKGSPAQAVELMRAHPFASLISVGEDGLPFVTHLPLHLEERADAMVLLGHCARDNPHWRLLERAPSVVTFLGPHAYQTPRIYPDLQRVPSWAYLAVHCTVQARLIEEPQAKDTLLKKLIGDHEPPYAEQWRGLDPAFADKLLSGIAAFELQVTALQCKLKLNQHRPESYAAMRAGYAQGSDQERELAAWMDRLGLGTPQ